MTAHPSDFVAIGGASSRRLAAIESVKLGTPVRLVERGHWLIDAQTQPIDRPFDREKVRPFETRWRLQDRRMRRVDPDRRSSDRDRDRERYRQAKAAPARQ